jgi:hypothetical protein
LLVVLSHKDDASAVKLVADWPGGRAALLTAKDLSIAGWWQAWPDDLDLVANFSGPAAIVSGRPILTRDITGVLTRRPRFIEQELVSINRADRAFVAAEMTAFMTAWLSQLSCPVLNRPSALSLCGPPWRHEEWTHLACTLRVPAVPRTRTASSTSRPAAPFAREPDQATAVTVVAKFPSGDRAPAKSAHGSRSFQSLECFNSFGEAHPCLHRHARSLAAAAGVGLLQVFFTSADSNGRFLSTSLWPPVHEPPVSSALRKYFGAGSRLPSPAPM